MTENVSRGIQIAKPVSDESPVSSISHSEEMTLGIFYQVLLGASYVFAGIAIYIYAVA